MNMTAFHSVIFICELNEEMLRFFSPAKINLFLRVVSKRADGYHELSSVFQTISLGDTLHVEPQAYDELTCSDSSLTIDRSNLIWKAVDLFRRKTNFHQGLKIHLEKRIPMQAGLGGGSSNAATILWACNQLAKSHIPLQVLQEWSAEIGSDVPFFFSQGTAYCTGKGEVVQALPALEKHSLWIVKPQEGLSTPEVYRHLNFETAHQQTSVINDLENFLSGKFSYFNDLEKAAFKVKPELAYLKNYLLESGFETVLMTGSGSAFFCLGAGVISIENRFISFHAHFINRNSPSNWYQE